MDRLELAVANFLRSLSKGDNEGAKMQLQNLISIAEGEIILHEIEKALGERHNERNKEKDSSVWKRRDSSSEWRRTDIGWKRREVPVHWLRK